MRVQFLFIVFISTVLMTMSVSADSGVNKMRKMMQGLMDDFFNDQSFSSFGQMNTLDIKKHSSIVEKFGKTFEKIEVFVDMSESGTNSNQQASFDIKVTDNVMVSSKMTSMTENSKSHSSSTQVFPIPDQGVYQPVMTQNLKNKVVLYFEVPNGRKRVSPSLDSFKQLDKLKQDLFEERGEPSQVKEPRRKVIIPQKKV